MDSGSSDDRKRERVKSAERSKRVTVRKTQLESKPKNVQLVLQKNKKVTVTGAVTGNTYVFDGAGSVQPVDERDVPQLLQKGANMKSCCSGAENAPYFRQLA